MPDNLNLRNELLAGLSAADFELLKPHIKPISLVQGSILYEAGDRIDRVYFPNTGIVSLVIALSSGDHVEAAMIGRDGAVGGVAALNGAVATSKAIVQIAGEGVMVELAQVRRLADSSPAFRGELIRHDQIVLLQAQQSAACNAMHTVEARLARWLLRCSDLVDGDTLALTQEFLAEMLGSRRSTISLVAGTLQNAGLIRYRRGNIRILDMDGLRAAACECYAAVRTQSELLLRRS